MTELQRNVQVAVVTGGSQGLGFELARRLVTDGWTVVTDARRSDRLADAARRIAGGPGSLVAVAGDVTDPAHRDELVRTAVAMGPVRLVVNNASTLGHSPLPPLDEIPLDVLRRTFEVNVIAPIALIQAFAPHLSDGAVIVDVTSDAAVAAYPTWGGYGSTKAALEHAGAVLAEEHPEWLVYTVDPGDMRTEMHQDAFPGEDISDRPLPADSVAGIIALLESGRRSGRYVAKELT